VSKSVSTRSPRQLWLLPVLLITVIATALGALVARSLYTDQSRLPPAPIESSPSSVPPGEQPGPADVQGLLDATAHPLYNTVHDLLQRYFDAINRKDYAAWSGTVTAARDPAGAGLAQRLQDHPRRQHHRLPHRGGR
jgi:hypothetical protein